MRLIRALTFLMFMMFAMTTDAVGVIIPQIIKTFSLGMAEAGSFHYATMGGIALAGVGLGFLADRLGRKVTILIGLSAFAVSALLFSVSRTFPVFLGLLFVSGLAIGVFKTGALALIGDICSSTKDHIATLNTLEGFFGLGAIVGPAVVARLLLVGASWTWLYVIAGGLCAVLIVVAVSVRYPEAHAPADEVQRIDLRRTLGLIRSPYVSAFSIGAMLYVGVETAIYVWMPTLLAGYSGPAVSLVPYALSTFFILRAGGRFLGSWMLTRMDWAAVLALCGFAILICFAGALVGGRGAALCLLPASGLFMSVVYPTLNSKGISCFPKSQHGGVAGVILFFTCISAVLAPLSMGVISDQLGSPTWAFVLATGLAALLFAGLAWNWLRAPTRDRLERLNATEY